MHLLLASRSTAKAAAAAAAASIAAAAELVYADGPFRLSSSSSSSSNPPSSSSSSSGGFDPESLERGVKDFGEINGSPHAKQVFDVMRKQEETRLAEMAAEKAQYQAVMAQKEVEYHHWTLLGVADTGIGYNCNMQNSKHMSETQRSALNALLFRTGDQSRDIVLATNRPGDLNAAISDRIVEVIEFPLPREEERFKLLKLYLNRYISSSQDDDDDSKSSTPWKSLFKRQQQKIVVEDASDDVIREAARKTEGFSGREIAKLMVSVQAAVYGRENCMLDSQLFMEIVDYKVAEHHQRLKLVSKSGSSQWNLPFSCSWKLLLQLFWFVCQATTFLWLHELSFLTRNPEAA